MRHRNSHVALAGVAALGFLLGCGDDDGDTTPPAVTVDTLSRWDTTPELRGTVDDATAAVTVTVDGQVNAATNNGDGTWTLTDDTLTALAPGTYDVAVTATDAAGNAGSDATTDELTIFGFTDIGAAMRGVERCCLAWGDYDSDGDLDLALAGFTGSTDISKVYRNDGGTFTDIGTGLTEVGWGPSLAWGDHDNDGDLDLALAGWSSGGLVSKVYRNDAGAFTDRAAALTGVCECSLAWGDYDNDGDLDLVLAGRDTSWNRISKVYRNDGGSLTDIGAGLTGASQGSLAWSDYDNDGDLDLALAGWSSGGPVSKVYRNDGSDTFADIFAGLTGVFDCSLAWGDYDNDDDLDLTLAGYTGSGYVSKVYRNDGGTFIDIGAAITGVERCSLAWGDYDSDGDLDLALAGARTGSPYDPISKVYRNDGGTFTDIGTGLTGVGWGSSLAWGDYDNDGDLDLALAGRWHDGVAWGPESKVYRNDGGVFNTPPAAPAGLGATYTGTGPYEVTFSWGSATDAETPSSGLSYNLRVGTTSGGNEVLSGMAEVATGWRKLPARGTVQPGLSRNKWTLTLPAGTYTLYWSVQAVDTAFAGSAWPTEQTTTVP